MSALLTSWRINLTLAQAVAENLGIELTDDQLNITHLRTSTV
ncbi:hypothetical protein ACLK19_11730 [Escherichia coli]